MFQRPIVFAIVLASAAAGAQEPPPPAQPPVPPAIAVSYDKGTVLRSADDAFELKLTGRLQSRFELLRDTADGADTISRFLIVRARLALEGFVFGKENAVYKAEFSFSDKGNPNLKDFYVDKAIAGGVWARIGQWKKPFNRQEIISDFALELAERALDAEFASGGRDIGVAVHNGYDRAHGGPEWVVALMNGTSEKASQKASTTCKLDMDPTKPPVCTTTVAAPSNQPADWRPLLVARAGWATPGMKAYSEADLEGGPLRFGVAASYRLDLHGATDSSAWGHAAEADAIVKVAGFDANGAIIVVKEPGADAKVGWHAQAGHFVVPKKAQLFARVAMVPAGEETETEVRGGFAWYWAGHALKWLTDGGAVATSGDAGTTEIQIRSQAQLIF